MCAEMFDCFGVPTFEGRCSQNEKKLSLNVLKTYSQPCTSVLSGLGMSTPRIAVVTIPPPARRTACPASLTMASSEPRLQSNGQQVSPANLDPNAIAGVPGQFGPRRTGYGLPCAKCKTYYAADLTACPVCKNKERVSPVIASLPVEPATAEELPDPIALEEERERFLKEFKSHIAASELESADALQNCSLSENHLSNPESARICQGCYDHLQERVDLMEAALHMDLKDASQIVYDAVWADPSDPNKTYQNAAQALLMELRKRAGVKLVLGPLQPLPH